MSICCCRTHSLYTFCAFLSVSLFRGATIKRYMSRRGLAALFLAIGIAIVVPSIALAASAGLVPCGVVSPGTSADQVSQQATECQACSIVTLIQGLITFLIGLSVPIAMAMFAYAGVLYFTSGAGGGNENISKARRIFSSTLMGFVLALASWLIVNTILNTIVSKAYFQNSGDWFHIKCTTREPGTDTLGSVITQHLGWAPAVSAPLPQETPNLTCNPGYIPKDGDCINSKGDIQTPTITNRSGTGATALCINSNCSPFALQSAGFNTKSAAAMSCIALTENGGRSTGCNGNACGTFQIMLTVNKLQGSACAQFNNGNPVLNCPALCKGSNGIAVQTQACQPCYQAANNSACNAQSAAALYDQVGYAPWTTSSDNQNSGSCVAKYGN